MKTLTLLFALLFSVSVFADNHCNPETDDNCDDSASLVFEGDADCDPDTDANCPQE